MFDQVSRNTLRVLSSQTPTAKVRGVIERVEVYYNGELEDMSDTLRAIASKSDQELAQRQRSQGKKVFTGAVDESFRIEGDPLNLDQIAIRFFITSSVPAGVGDGSVSDPVPLVSNGQMEFSLIARKPLEPCVLQRSTKVPTRKFEKHKDWVTSSEASVK